MKFIKYVLIVFGLITTYGCFGSQDKRILILATPKSAELVDDNFQEGKLTPPIWRVELEDAVVIEGASDVIGATLVINIKSHQKAALLNGSQIIVAVELNDSKPRALYWEKLIKLVCIPESLLKEDYQDSYFANPFGREGVVCKFIRK